MEMARKTEKAIATALKQLLATKPLSKITISDIANECGINRMTFYYHYRDVYDLIEHICDDTLRTALEGNRSIADWQDGVLRLMQAMQADRAFFTGIYHSAAKDRFFNYLFHLIEELLQEGIDEVGPLSVTKDEQQFIIDFYNYAFCGIVVRWLSNGMKEDPKEIVDRMGIVGKGGLKRSVDAFQKAKA